MKPPFAVLWSIASRIWGPFNARRSLVRLSLLLAPWLILLTAAPLRPLFIHNEVMDLEDAWNSTWGYEDKPSRHDLIKKAARQNPGDLALQYFAAIQNPNGYDYYDDYFIVGSGSPYADDTVDEATVQKRKELVKKFPQQKWLTAWQLEGALRNYSHDSRMAEHLESSKNAGYSQPSAQGSSRAFIANYQIPKTKPSPKRISPTFIKPAIPAATQRALETQLGLAQSARRAEPDNTYYDWIVMRYLFALWRDDEAVAVLRQSARKTRYDSHLREGQRARFEAKKFLGLLRPQQLLHLDSPDEQDSLTTRRHVLQMIVARAARYEKAGDHKTALEIYADAQKLVSLLRDGAYSIREGRAACAFAEIAWDGTARITTEKQVVAADTQMRGRTWMRLSAGKFASYARAHGRNDLAQLATGEGQKFGAYREKIEKTLVSRAPWPRRPTRYYVALTAIQIMVSVLLVQSFLLICYRCITFFGLAPAGLKNSPIATRDVMLGMLLTGIATMVCGAAGGLFFAMQTIASTFPPYTRSYGGAVDMVAFASVAYAFLMPVLGTAVLCAIVTMYRQEKERRAGGDGWKQRAIAKLQRMRRFESPFRAYFPASDLCAIIVSWGVVLSAFAGSLLFGYSALAEWQGWNKRIDLPIFGSSEIVVIGLVLMLPAIPVALIGWLLKWRWAANKRWKANAHYALNWYRQTLSWWTILLGWFTLVTIAASVPVAAKVEHEILASIVKGEVATLLANK